MVELTSKEVLREFLMTKSEWNLDSVLNALTRTFNFRTYMEGVAFANQVAELAEKHDHHPEIIINWAKVTIKSTTHDAENTVTIRDIELVQAINDLERG